MILIEPEFGSVEGRGGELPRAAWRIASLLLPGCGMNPTIRIVGDYGIGLPVCSFSLSTKE